eukprot:466122_1
MMSVPCSIPSSISSSSESDTDSNIITQMQPLEQNETLSGFTQRLIDSNILIKLEENINPNYNKIKKELIGTISDTNDTKPIQKRPLYCWIEPVRITNETTFEFEYKLIMQYKAALYYSPFNVAFHHIQELHQAAIESKYFPIRAYPSVHSDITKYPKQFRNKELVEDMKQEETYMMLPLKLKHKGPGRKSFTFNTQRQAQQHHLIYFAQILQIIINCPSFAIQDCLYNILRKNKDNIIEEIDINIATNEQQPLDNYKKKVICKDLELLIKHTAFKKLCEWRHNLKFIVRKYEDPKDENALCKGIPSNGNPAKGSVKFNWRPLKNIKFLSNITFFSVMVVSCPQTSNPAGDHWAVIFEGKYHNLILEYFLDGKSKEDFGFVSFKLMPNNIIGQRTCWYSNCASKRDKYINAEMFNDRWSTLRKTILLKSSFGKEATFNFIHKLVKIWMSRPEYYATTNNCQHFCRNIYAVFDKQEAKFLNVKFDHRKMTLFIPSGPIGDGLKEGLVMEMFVEEVKKEVKYVHEEAVNNWENIAINLGVNEFMYVEDNIIKHQSSKPLLNQNRNIIHEQKFDEETLKHKQIAKELLKEWRIPDHYMDNILLNMIVEDVIRIEDWIDIVDDEQYLITKIGFTGPHSKRFKKEYHKWSNNQNNNK